jgi:hypothetical protein
LFRESALSLLRYAKRQDLNAPELVELARRLGALVIYIWTPVDLLVFFRGKWNVVEIKSKDGTYTKAQTDFLKECDACDAEVLTWRNESDVLKLLDNP